MFILSQNAFALYNENIIDGCDEPKIFYPVFEINTYTCDNGYFLPADTLGCKPCPSGHICNGGTFDYNPTISQGIKYTSTKTENTPNACSINFGTVFFPIFEPNTVEVKFDNDNGNTTTTTCSYDGNIELPATPEKTGYTFKGWKLITGTK